MEKGELVYYHKVPFPTNPINALEASQRRGEFYGGHPRFPTNPINALEASEDGTAAVLTSIPFPTNPINALEARRGLPSPWKTLPSVSN